MTVHLVVEEEYSTSTWCHRIQGGLNDYAKLKRIKAVKQQGDFDVQSDDAVVVIGTGCSWIEEKVAFLLEKCDAPVILVSNRPYELAVTNICTDVYSMMKEIVSYLESCGKMNIALYGVNPSSANDGIKEKAFGSRDVYYSYGNLKKCFEDFFENIHKYDAVVCTNDFAAISLINNLKQRKEEEISRLFIVSNANTNIAERFEPKITSVAMNYEEYGRVAIDVCRMMNKNRNISSATVYIKSNIVVRETTDNIPCKSTQIKNIPMTTAKTDFYDDEEIKPYVVTEKILCESDETDINIVKKLLKGASYESIASESYLTVNGLKYRLKRLLESCGVENTKELVKCVKSAGLL